jgi:hypothetical protein
MVYDQNVKLPGCEWTDDHSAQGFARRDSTVNFSTLLEFGYADVFVSQGFYQPKEDYERVIAVPFLVTSGRVVVEGPEETNIERGLSLLPGNYRLVATQATLGEEEEAIHLFFEPLADRLEQSVLLIADKGLKPPNPLLESAAIAGEA